MIVTGSFTFGAAASTPILTVAQLTRLIRNSIEIQFDDVWIQGEISNLRTPGSGHIYCTLKDETSQIRAVLFRSSVLRLRFALREGMQIVARGRLSVYEPRGEYQIVLELVEPKGVGALQLAFEQLKERLAGEGLFDLGRKKSLPPYPRTVGVVTSPSGAAIRDILAVLRRRWPILHIIIIPVQVQGEGAAEQIAAAVRWLNSEQPVDVIILGRGGGSLEDLWSFNEEAVVRAVAGSVIPTVSAVGHEIDMTLTDFAADVRAPTPSVAAEIVVPVLEEVLDRLHDDTARMRSGMVRLCQSEGRRFASIRRGLLHFRLRLQGDAQQLDDFAGRLGDAVWSRLSQTRRRLHRCERTFAARSPLIAVTRSLALLPQLVKRLDRQIRVGVLQRRRRVEELMALLNTVSPLAILGRGYCILSRIPGGQLVKRTGDVRVHDHVSARLADGTLHCTVERVAADGSSV